MSVGATSLLTEGDVDRGRPLDVAPSCSTALVRYPEVMRHPAGRVAAQELGGGRCGATASASGRSALDRAQRRFVGGSLVWGQRADDP